jgi:uncharacterized protein
MLVDIKPIARSTGESLPVELSGTPDSIGLAFPGYRFSEPVTFSGQVANTGDGLLVLSGTVATSFEGDCGRCLRPVHGTLSVPVVETYRSRYHADVGRREEKEEDDGTGYRFDGWSIDVSEALRDDLALSLPARVLCREECKGLCPVCFADRNERDCGHEDRDGNATSPFGRLEELL